MKLTFEQEDDNSFRLVGHDIEEDAFVRAYRRAAIFVREDELCFSRRDGGLVVVYPEYLELDDAIHHAELVGAMLEVSVD